MLKPGQIAHYKIQRHIRFRTELPMTVSKPQKLLMRGDGRGTGAGDAEEGLRAGLALQLSRRRAVNSIGV
ncbi:hypothetical protein NP945_08705 [Mesorhizobium sp. LMG17149]|uniref:hypothetical protein n=1 Tax=Mesorhizobium sp. LMG17149 TaxID=2968497 RepID=UPI000FCA92EF|nr:hypothetical protein [Mesorhizobium sp. LMG17149]MCQ8871901.1 hypothetical protein [Mesorhizobium sp. LMG17149]RUV18325.1 hypothetical protein EOB80_23645 [Mesorhizobium sp. M7A.F.Ca.MR.245.00.0.0]RUV49716.1 hypothetical protein EOB77_18350 [Mesorhizobium sp. M7A.F.Ca.MR.228.00.0.0]RWN87867.1 MAG: hypothetical protein EOS05_31710 [Mesorhizobium sp.]